MTELLVFYCITLQQTPGWLKSPLRAMAGESEVFSSCLKTLSEDLQIFSEADLFFPKHVFCRRHLPQHPSCACAIPR